MSSVTFGGTSASFTVVSPTQISVVAPAHAAGTVDVQVNTSNGSSATSSADQFSYVSPLAVTSLGVSSGSTAGGTSVTISGSQLSTVTGVKFGTVAAASFSYNSSNGTITAASPAEAAGFST